MLIRRRIHWRRCCAVLLLQAAALSGGCAFHVYPPTNVAQPKRVVLADYGAHASIILPREDGRYSEFAYGEWEWFVRDQRQWYRVVPVLLLPTKAGLGTRDLPDFADMPEAYMTGAERHFAIDVEAANVAALLADLDARIAGDGQSLEYNERSRLNFQQDKRPYSLLRQCNSMVAYWLRQLGCRVTGTSITARFIVHDDE